MGLELEKALEVKNIDETVAKNNEQPQWKVDLMAARIAITTKLLIDSYYAIGIPLPDGDTIAIRAAQIADRADVSNRQLKDAFLKAISVKMDKDLRAPITYGEITKAARMVAEDTGKTIFGKWKLALPLLSDGELWDDSVKYFAKTHAQKEFAELVELDRKLLTNG
jgi:hypothetical protein